MFTCTGTRASLLLTLGALAACGAPPDVTADGAPVSAALLPLGGMERPRHGRPPCSAAAHRQFDFWVGKWDVFDPDSALVGTNVVTTGLSGCSVEEHWIDSTGSRGRSLNAYDPQTGRWHQTWVAEALGHLRMSGGLDAQGRMVMEGRRVAAQTGFELLDRYVWTPIAADRVRQEGTLDIPARGLHFSFDGLYLRRAAVTPIAPTGGTSCQVGGSAAASRDLDFALGRWSVAIEGGPPVASSEISADLSGCLFQEDLRAALGYAARSYVYYDPTVRRWFQTLVDDRGGRLELSGTLSGGRLTLTAEAPDALRVTWEAAGASALQQRWEISPDGGGRWIPALSLRYRRR